MMTFEGIVREILGYDNVTSEPYIVLSDGLHDGKFETVYENPAAGRYRYKAVYDLPINDIWDLAIIDNAITLRRRLTNESEESLDLVELGLNIKGLQLGNDQGKDYFYHNENPRIYQKMAIPVDMVRSEDIVDDREFDVLAGNKWIDAGIAGERIGASPYQPFPAVLISNYDEPFGVVHGSLSQKIFYHNYLVKHTDGQLVWDILSSCMGIESRIWKSGKSLKDFWYLGRCDQADDIEYVFDNFSKVLRKHLPPLHGSGQPNRHTAVWGSWNDGIFRDFDQQRIKEATEFIRKELPTVEWVQIDDGYATLSRHGGGMSHGVGAVYEPDYGMNQEKIPDGLSGLAQSIRDKGLRPALWVGGLTSKDTPVYRERPELFMQDHDALPRRGCFDVSKQATREYIENALDVLLTEPAFDACKLDFWSYAFERHNFRHASRKKTGYEWRSWYLGEFCKRLATDGYLEAGCDIGMGNPFLAEFFNNYRYGIDIGAGDWENIKTNFLWAAACIALHTGDLFVPNSDAIGIFENLPDTELKTLINFCLISRTLVEVSGWLQNYKDHPRLKWVKKAICCLENGGDVHFADYDYRSPNATDGPTIWYFNKAYFSHLSNKKALPLRTVGLFNMEDNKKNITLTPAKLNLPVGKYLVTDIWNNTTQPMENELNFSVNPHDSVLVTVTAADKLNVVDANIEISNIMSSNRELAVNFAYGGELELKLSAKPTNYDCEAKAGHWIIRKTLNKPSTLSIKF